MLQVMATFPADPQAPLRAIVADLGGAQKSNRNAPGYSRWINRPLGRVLAAVAFKMGATPNAVTALSAVCTFSAIGGLALLPPTPVGSLACALGLVIGYALDSADGQLARLRGGGTVAGEWLDHVVDCFKLATFHLAVAVMWFTHWTPDRLPVVSVSIPLAYSVQSNVWFFALILSDLLMRLKGVRADPRERRPEAAPVLASLLALPADYGLLCLVMAFVGWPTVFIPTYTALAIANVALLLFQTTRWYRRMALLR